MSMTATFYASAQNIVTAAFGKRTPVYLLGTPRANQAATRLAKQVISANSEGFWGTLAWAEVHALRASLQGFVEADSIGVGSKGKPFVAKYIANAFEQLQPTAERTALTIEDGKLRWLSARELLPRATRVHWAARELAALRLEQVRLQMPFERKESPQLDCDTDMALQRMIMGLAAGLAMFSLMLGDVMPSLYLAFGGITAKTIHASVRMHQAEQTMFHRGSTERFMEQLETMARVGSA